MGQKTHPKGFRLISKKDYLSKWYSEKKIYSSLLAEDCFLREKTEEKLKELLNISKIEIIRVHTESKKDEIVHLIINAFHPREKDMYRKVVEFATENKEFEKKVEKYISTFSKSKGKLKILASFLIKRKIRALMRFLSIQTKKRVTIGLRFFRNIFEDAVLTAKFIGEQLKRRVAFRRIMKLTIRKVKLAGIKGVKIEISGRLNGVEMARSEWKREGRIPLHTLRENIDYTHQKCETVYGVMGVKVWLLKT